MLWLQEKQAEKLSECVGDTHELERLQAATNKARSWETGLFIGGGIPWRSDTATVVEI
jgi:hypothetical protein